MSVATKFQRRADCRAEEILQAAMDVLCEKGFRSTRLDDIAARAGVTKPLIYHYFRDKEDLVHRALEWRLNQVLAERREELRALKGDWETRLRFFAGWQWAKWSHPDSIRFFRIVNTEMRQEAPDLHDRWVALAYGERCRLVQEILEMAGTRLRRGLDPADASRMLVATLWSLAQSPSEDDRRDALLSTTLDIFIAGIRRSAEDA